MAFTSWGPHWLHINLILVSLVIPENTHKWFSKRKETDCQMFRVLGKISMTKWIYIEELKIKCLIIHSWAKIQPFTGWQKFLTVYFTFDILGAGRSFGSHMGEGDRKVNVEVLPTCRAPPGSLRFPKQWSWPWPGPPSTSTGAGQSQWHRLLMDDCSYKPWARPKESRLQASWTWTSFVLNAKADGPWESSYYIPHD